MEDRIGEDIDGIIVVLDSLVRRHEELIESLYNDEYDDVSKSGYKELLVDLGRHQASVGAAKNALHRIRVRSGARGENWKTTMGGGDPVAVSHPMDGGLPQ